MKKSIRLFVVCLLFSSIGFSQTNSFDAFVKKYKHQPSVVHLTIPGFVVRMGGMFADKEDLKDFDFRPLLRHIRKIKILVFNDTLTQTIKDDVKNLVAGVRAAHFEDLVFVREGAQRVNVMVRENGDKIKNILIMVTSSDKKQNNSVFLSLSGNFKMADINKMIQSNNSEVRDER